MGKRLLMTNDMIKQPELLSRMHPHAPENPIAPFSNFKMRLNIDPVPIVAAICVALAMLPQGAQAEDTIDFATQVKPILETSCVRCHGPAHGASKPRAACGWITRQMPSKAGLMAW